MINNSNSKQIVNINNNNNDIVNDDDDDYGKSVVLEEEKYVDSLSRIIQRDYFPDLPNLKRQIEWMHAVESNDLSRMQSIQLQSIRRLNTSIRQRINTNQNSFDTPTPAPTLNPNSTPNIQQTPNTSTMPNTQQLSHDNDIEKDITEGVSLDQFVANYKSEDDHSYSEIAKKNIRENNQRFKWLEDASSKQNQLLLTDSNAKNAPDTWNHTVRNRLMYYPEGKSKSYADPAAVMGPPKEIVHENTRISADLKQRQKSAAESQAEATPFHALSLPEQLARLQRMEKEGHTLDASTLGFLSTPQLTPSNLQADYGESPLMTWGRIDGTPLLLPNNPLSTPISIPSSSTRTPFKIPDTPAREKIAHSLADKGTLSNNTAKKSQKQTSSAKNMSMLSPAAQRMMSLRSPNFLKKSPLLSKDQQLQKSYQQSPKRSVIDTPNTKQKNLFTPAPKPIPLPKVEPQPTLSAEKPLTDDLLNF